MNARNQWVKERPREKFYPHHGDKKQPTLSPEDPVLVSDSQTFGKVVKKIALQLYQTETEKVEEYIGETVNNLHTSQPTLIVSPG